MQNICVILFLQAVQEFTSFNECSICLALVAILMVERNFLATFGRGSYEEYFCV